MDVVDPGGLKEAAALREYASCASFILRRKLPGSRIASERFLKGFPTRVPLGNKMDIQVSLPRHQARLIT